MLETNQTLGGGVKTIWIVTISAVVTAGVIGGGTYYLVNAKATKDKDALQVQITTLNTKVADTEKSLSDAQAVTQTPSQTVTDATANWKTLSSTKYGFSLKYPAELTTSTPSMTGTIDNNTSDFTISDANVMLFEIKVIGANEFQGTDKKTIDYVSLPFNDYVSKLWQENKNDTTNPDGSAVKNKAVTAISDTTIGKLTAKTFNISGTYKGPDESSVLSSASKTEYGTHTYYFVDNNGQKVQIHFPTDYANGKKIINTITFK